MCMNLHIHIYTPLHPCMRISSELRTRSPPIADKRLTYNGRGGGGNDVEVKGRSFCRNCYLCPPPISVRFCGREPNVCWGIREPEQPLAHNIHTFHFCASKRHRFVSRSWQLRASSRFETRVCVWRRSQFESFSCSLKEAGKPYAREQENASKMLAELRGRQPSEATPR